MVRTYKISGESRPDVPPDDAGESSKSDTILPVKKGTVAAKSRLFTNHSQTNLGVKARNFEPDTSKSAPALNTPKLLTKRLTNKRPDLCRRANRSDQVGTLLAPVIRNDVPTRYKLNDSITNPLHIQLRHVETRHRCMGYAHSVLGVSKYSHIKTLWNVRTAQPAPNAAAMSVPGPENRGRFKSKKSITSKAQFYNNLVASNDESRVKGKVPPTTPAMVSVAEVKNGTPCYIEQISKACNVMPTIVEVSSESSVPDNASFIDDVGEDLSDTQNEDTTGQDRGDQAVPQLDLGNMGNDEAKADSWDIEIYSKRELADKKTANTTHPVVPRLDLRSIREDECITSKHWDIELNTARSVDTRHPSVRKLDLSLLRSNDKKNSSKINYSVIDGKPVHSFAEISKPKAQPKMETAKEATSQGRSESVATDYDTWDCSELEKWRERRRQKLSQEKLAQSNKKSTSSTRIELPVLNERGEWKSIEVRDTPYTKFDFLLKKDPLIPQMDLSGLNNEDVNVKECAKTSKSATELKYTIKDRAKKNFSDDDNVDKCAETKQVDNNEDRECAQTRYVTDGDVKASPKLTDVTVEKDVKDYVETRKIVHDTMAKKADITEACAETSNVTVNAETDTVPIVSQTIVPTPSQILSGTGLNANVDEKPIPMNIARQIFVSKTSQTMVPMPSKTVVPTVSKTVVPTASETVVPTVSQTMVPTPSKTVVPTASKIVAPTASETVVPTASKIVVPTASKTVVPTASETMVPTPSENMGPTASLSIISIASSLVPYSLSGSDSYTSTIDSVINAMSEESQIELEQEAAIQDIDSEIDSMVEYALSFTGEVEEEDELTSNSEVMVNTPGEIEIADVTLEDVADKLDTEVSADIPDQQPEITESDFEIVASSFEHQVDVSEQVVDADVHEQKIAIETSDQVTEEAERYKAENEVDIVDQEVAYETLDATESSDSDFEVLSHDSENEVGTSCPDVVITTASLTALLIDENEYMPDFEDDTPRHEATSNTSVCETEAQAVDPEFMATSTDHEIEAEAHVSEVIANSPEPEIEVYQQEPVVRANIPEQDIQVEQQYPAAVDSTIESEVQVDQEDHADVGSMIESEVQVHRQDPVAVGSIIESEVQVHRQDPVAVGSIIEPEVQVDEQEQAVVANNADIEREDNQPTLDLVANTSEPELADDGSKTELQENITESEVEDDTQGIEVRANKSAPDIDIHNSDVDIDQLASPKIDTSSISVKEEIARRNRRDQEGSMAREMAVQKNAVGKRVTKKFKRFGSTPFTSKAMVKWAFLSGESRNDDSSTKQTGDSKKSGEAKQAKDAMPVGNAQQTGDYIDAIEKASEDNGCTTEETGSTTSNISSNALPNCDGKSSARDQPITVTIRLNEAPAVGSEDLADNSCAGRVNGKNDLKKVLIESINPRSVGKVASLSADASFNTNIGLLPMDTTEGASAHADVSEWNIEARIGDNASANAIVNSYIIDQLTNKVTKETDDYNPYYHGNGVSSVVGHIRNKEHCKDPSYYPPGLKVLTSNVYGEKPTRFVSLSKGSSNDQGASNMEVQ